MIVVESCSAGKHQATRPIVVADFQLGATTRRPLHKHHGRRDRPKLCSKRSSRRINRPVGRDFPSVARTATIWLQVIRADIAPYSSLPRGPEQWVDIKFSKPVAVPKDFWVALDFRAGPYERRIRQFRRERRWRMSGSGGKVLARRVAEEVCFLVVGRVGASHCPALRQFAEDNLARGATRVQFDLRDCTHCDSTFLGTLIRMRDLSRSHG